MCKDVLKKKQGKGKRTAKISSTSFMTACSDVITSFIVGLFSSKRTISICSLFSPLLLFLVRSKPPLLPPSLHLLTLCLIENVPSSTLTSVNISSGLSSPSSLMSKRWKYPVLYCKAVSRSRCRSCCAMCCTVCS